MAGGLFTINKKFFEHLGTYDPEFKLWGSENMELSFKIWMCGGSLEILPCSVVCHVFRDSSPMHLDLNLITRNSHRVAEVWLDEYKDIYYENTGIKLQNIGNISSRLDLRRQLNCQSFEWYIKNIYPEVFLPTGALFKGKLHSLAKPELCLYSGQKRATNKPVLLAPCHPVGMTQFWYVTLTGELRSSYNCLDVGLDKTLRSVKMDNCHGHQGNQLWEYTQDQTLRNPKVNGCLTINLNTNEISFQLCNEDISQKWKWEPFKS